MLYYMTLLYKTEKQPSEVQSLDTPSSQSKIRVFSDPTLGTS